MRNTHTSPNSQSSVKELPPPNTFNTLVDLLQHRACHQPTRPAYTFLLDGESEEIQLTYSQLHHQARAIAAWLQTRQSPGARVLLLYPPGLEFIAAFFGCLYAGCVAVPAYPPRLNRSMARLQSIVADAQAGVVFTTGQILDKIERRLTHLPDLAALQWLATDSLNNDAANLWQPPSIGSNTLAFLQYTSGSTATPKGVMVTHHNLLHNQQLIQTSFQHTEQDVFVGWLPLYHDMGLIGNVLQPLYVGASCILMSPMAFLQKPLRWLQAITHYKATTSGGPNFAYDLCVRRITPEQRNSLNLSSWRLAFNGAEPVRAETLERFSKAFESCGFQPEAFYPCYGLAEATLMVSGGSKTAAPVTCTVQGPALARNRVVAAGPESKNNSQTLVSCGQTLLNQQIVIVDPQTRAPCSPGRVGEIWVSGPSVAQGYWNNPTETARTFEAYLAGSGQGPFLRTGDLGFLKNGELYITGRLKDLIVIRGRNYYPQDIEQVAEQSHPALRPGCGAAFSIEANNEERLALVYEVKREHRRDVDIDQVARAVRGAVADNFELPLYAFVLVKTATVPKTTSGKIQRHRCRAQFLADELDVVGRSNLSDSYFRWHADAQIGLQDAYAPPRTPTEEMLAQIWAKVLGLDEVGIHHNFFELGGHSLLATQVISRVRETLHVDLPLRALFEEPTIARFATRVEAARRAGETAQIPPITPVSREEALLLSFSQERMWFLDQFEPTGAAYNIPIAIRLRGALNVAALEKSFNRLAHRHQVLRTTFTNVGGRPVQTIAPTPAIELPTVDLTHLPPAEREDEARRLANAQARQPFNLAAGPLLRVSLIRLAAREYILLVNMHHIISDAWSMSVLWQEVALLYNAFTAQKSSPLAELPIQYADFAHWQRQWLRGNVLTSQLNYWKQQLAGAPQVLELPTDRPRPATQTFRGAFKTVSLPDTLIETLRVLSRQQGVTLFMTLLAAFKVLLYRYTGQTDILVGTPIANRHWLAVENLLGTFVNTLVMRTNLAGNPAFSVLLERVRQVALAAYAHQDLPFEQLVEALQPQRDLSHTPLVQVTFNVANAPMPNLQISNLEWDVFNVDRGAAQFDLSLSLTDMPQLQMMTVEYNTDLFDESTITRMMGHFRTLLEGIVTNPEQHILDLPLLPESEKEQLLTRWNDTQTPYPENLCVHQLFDAQAAQTPDATAVTFAEERLTYHQLNHRANQLAAYLQSLGVGPEVPVGLCVERSPEMVVGLLGILKAGGAYVPLDPTNPPERLQIILEDAQVPLLLTQARLLPQLPHTTARTVCLDTDWPEIAQQPGENPTRTANPNNLAYVIYTSGSTGRPKGVAIPHRGLVNYLSWCLQAYPLGGGQGAPVHSSISFDLTITGLFAPLLAGQPVHLLPPGLGVEALTTALQNQPDFSLVKLTPAHLDLLGRQLPAREAAGKTRAFIIGGENLLAEQLAFWRQAAPNTVLINEYGPTETVVGCCVYQVPQDGVPESGSVPIGRPIANTQLYLLDSHLQPVPIGVPGELYIGGAGVARGYLNRPDLTAASFVPNPFSTRPGARLYKTGDLARYLPDGNLEFLGRIDHQVKIRGFRIELGEIEAVLKQHPAVQEAAAAVREDTPGDKRLVAYVVPKNQPPAADELQKFLGHKLPDYMLPSAVVPMESLPLSANGKVNRRALPAPDQAQMRQGKTYAAPGDALEQQLAQIWADILNVRPVGITDNFFELGGHSLLAVRVFAQIEKALGKSLPVVTLFRAPTIAQLANVLRQEDVTPTATLVPIQPQGSRPPFFCVHGMGGGVLDYADLARYLGPEQPFYGLQERALDDAHLPFTHLEEMATHYVKEIQTLQPQGPYFIGGYCYGGTVAFEMARQLKQQGHQIALLAIMDNSPPNVGYDESAWKPGYWLKFFKNLPYWLHDFVQLSPAQMWARIKRKVRIAGQALARRIRPANGEPTWADIEAIIDDDLSQIPQRHHRLLKAHYKAMSNYVPQPYRGKVTLFRTRRRSLFGPFDPRMGWGGLATEGVEIKEIVGFHANILQEPHVQILARQLKASLDQAGEPDR